MNNIETLELTKIRDDIDRRLKGLVTEDISPISRQARIPFKEYVFQPALIAGILGAAACGGFLVVVVIGYNRMFGTPIDKSVAALVIMAVAVSTGAVTMAVPFYALMQDWRRLMWKYRKESVERGKKIEERGRIISRVEDRRSIVTRAEWDQRWEETLAKRVFDETEKWIGGVKVARKQLAGLYTNTTEKYEEARLDLRELGYLDDDDEWTDKARTVLLTKLRIV